MARYIQLNWKQCSSPRFVKSDYAFSYAQAYTHGVNVIIDEPAELRLLVFDDETDCAYESANFIDSVRSILGWCKITKQRVEKLRQYFKNCEFEISCNEVSKRCIERLLRNYTE